MQQKHAANSKADKKFEPFSKPSMTETFKLEEQRALEALEAVGLVEGIRQTIDGSKQLRVYPIYINTNIQEKAV